MHIVTSHDPQKDVEVYVKLTADAVSFYADDGEDLSPVESVLLSRVASLLGRADVVTICVLSIYLDIGGSCARIYLDRLSHGFQR